MLVRRLPGPSLQPFVGLIWATDQIDASPPRSGAREHVLPTGYMHLAFRLSGEPLRVFDGDDDLLGKTLGHAVLGGARSTFYVRDVSTPSCSVGAMLRPGAAHALFSIPADELSGRHWRLEDLLGMEVDRVQERLNEAGRAERRLDILETFLASRLRSVHGMHPAVAYSIERFNKLERVGDVVSNVGFSHRHFISLFRRSVGLTPKLYSRVVRFQKSLSRIGSEESRTWAWLALDLGYSDQAHFIRDFNEFSGFAPGDYDRINPPFPNHVPLAAASSTS